MATLTGRPLDATYRDLLQVPNDNGGIDATPRAVEDGGGRAAILMLADAVAGVKGWMYAELDAGAADNAAALQAFDAASQGEGHYDTLAIVKPGTYTLGPVVIRHVRRLVVGAGVTLKLKAGQAAQAKMIDVQRADFTLDLFGTLDGNRASQGTSADQALVHSYQFDRVQVNGQGGNGLVTGCAGRGVYLRDADDLLITGLRGTDCLLEPVVIECVTKPAMARPRIAACVVDRTAEDFSGVDPASHTGCIKITASQPGTAIVHGAIERCVAHHAASNRNVAIEMWANDAQSMQHGRIDNCTTDGPALGIGQSVANGIGCAIVSPVARNASLQVELADCHLSSIEGGIADCNGVAGSHGATIDNAHHDGYGNRCVGLAVSGFKAVGIKLVPGAGWATRARDAVVAACYLSSSHAGAQAIVCDGGNGAKIDGNVIRVTGQASYGIVAGNGSGMAASDNRLALGQDATGIYFVDGDHLTGRGNDFESLVSGAVAYGIQNVLDGEFTGGTMKGGFAQGANVVASASAGCTDRLIIGGWAGGPGINLVEQGAGTIGPEVRTRPIQGWYPWGIVHEAWFERYLPDMTTSVWGGGFMPSGDPNTWSGGIPGADGSKLTAGGTLKVRRSGSWTDAA